MGRFSEVGNLRDLSLLKHIVKKIPALVGNDAVDQVEKFNRALLDHADNRSNPRGIDTDYSCTVLRNGSRVFPCAVLKNG